eukprot:SAG25_NODE_6881_length_521_cov_1.322275_1_plen_159_part_01
MMEQINSPAEKEMCVCTICLEEDSRDKLVAACACAATVHPACLERWINTRPSMGGDRHTCEVCRSPYNLRVTNKLGTDRICSSDSWAQYITCCMLLLMFMMLAFVIGVYVKSEEYESEENKDTEWLLWVLVAATAVLFLSTMVKVFGRWRDANTHDTIV